MKNIAILASGSGTNAENIIRYFADSANVRVKIVLSNRPDAYALTRAANLGVETGTFTREQLYDSNDVAEMLRGVDLVVLAGFLWLVPQSLIEAFPDRIINIHPALLPKYGGKGMYGERVHRAVVEAGETQSGITIHRVNALYDKGDVIARFTVDILPSDTPEEVAQKVHQLEYEHFPRVIAEQLEPTKE